MLYDTTVAAAAAQAEQSRQNIHKTHQDHHTQPGFTDLYYQFTTEKPEAMQANSPHSNKQQQHQHLFSTKESAHHGSDFINKQDFTASKKIQPFLSTL